MSRQHSDLPRGEGHVGEALSAYIDGALGENQRGWVRAHLEECGVCRADHDELLATKQMLASMPVIAPPRAFTLTQEMVAPRASLWQRLLTPQYAPRMAMGSALAFALLLFILVGNLISMRSYEAASGVIAPSAEMFEQTQDIPASGEGSGQRRQADVGSTPAAGDLYFTNPSGAAELEATAAAKSAAQATPVTDAIQATAAETPTPEAKPRAVPTTATGYAAGGAPPSEDEAAKETAQDIVVGGLLRFSERSELEREYSAHPTSETSNENISQIVIPALTLALALLAIALAVGAVVARQRGT